MIHRRSILLFLALSLFLSLRAQELKVLQMNIWQEGTMVEGGFDAIADEVARLEPDIVMFSEVRNYNGQPFIPRIREALRKRGKAYYGESSSLDVGILSRYKIKEQRPVYPLENDAGSVLKARLDVDGKEVVVYSAHLDYTHYACYMPRGYSGMTWKKMDAPVTDAAEVEKANQESLRDEAIRGVIEDAGKDRADFILLGGDFNEPSHLDWTERTKSLWDHNGAVVRWDCSTLLYHAGFEDAYRVRYPDPVTHPGFTFPSDNPAVPVQKLAWAPEADERDRIDYIYYLPNRNWKLLDIAVVGPSTSIIRGERREEGTQDTFITPVAVWPTDHKAVLATFRLGDNIRAEAFANQALRLEGKDNNVRTGIGILKPPFTLEAWIKGDDIGWRPEEVIIGGDEYNVLEQVDCLPLSLKDGKLRNASARLTSATTLDNRWHHVALTCDGKQTSLYLDGKLQAQRDTALSILPAAIGVNQKAETIFGGWIDEVRIWNASLTKQQLTGWMNIPVSPAHPAFQKLVAYYPFDDGIDDSATNWVGRGALACHLRNTRLDYKGKAPLAFTVPNDNPSWKQPSKSAMLNAVVVDSEWDTSPAAQSEPLLKLRIALTGTAEPLYLDEISLDLSETTALSDISRLHLYYTGQKARSHVRRELPGSGVGPQQQMTFRFDGNERIRLMPGINYLLLTADMAENACPGNRIKVQIPAFRLSGKSYQPEAATGTLDKRITPVSRPGVNIVKVLQWNIWHGGEHLGYDGQEQIIRLIRSTNADIITMQEGYGAQQRIADSLGFYMRTASLKDNLVLLSRYPMVTKPSFHTFNSNPARIMLPGGQPLLVNACWLRYSYRPSYTDCFPNPGQNTDLWVAEDSILPMADVKNILYRDTYPVLAGEDMPVIIGGDFNSCSHLDWTGRAAHLHYGYGPVSFPTSRYMYEQGFIDSFREMNPDELARPEGTFAGIFGHLPNNRIDFIYYKGSRLRAVSSKIIQTSPEIDDVWASDHSAVLTVFEYGF